MNLYSSIGKKFIMGLTGVILLFFIIGHLIGNLSLYNGAIFFNNYAYFIQSMPNILFIIRIFLLCCFLSHIFISINLTRKNKIARPIGYKIKKSIKATITSKTMILSGILILVFFMFHIAHLTTGYIYPEYYKLTNAIGQHDVYSMVILSFQNYWIATIYILAQILLAMHISHGFSSSIQTFGLKITKSSNLIKLGGNFLAISIFLSYISIPISILLGIISI